MTGTTTCPQCGALLTDARALTCPDCQANLFADAMPGRSGDVNPYASPTAVGGSRRAVTHERMFWPAVLLLATAVGGLSLTALSAVGYFTMISGRQAPGEPSQDNMMIGLYIAMTAQCVIALHGAVHMLARWSRFWAMLGAWAIMAPMCGCYLVGFPAGIWALSVLWPANTRKWFASGRGRATRSSIG